MSRQGATARSRCGKHCIDSCPLGYEWSGGDPGVCEPVVCSSSGDVGDICAGLSGDLAGDVNTDGYYCDTNVNVLGMNKCCPTGQFWSGSSCTTPAVCDNFCNENAFTEAWWADDSCVETGNDRACTNQGTLLGQPDSKRWRDAVSYSN